jgi:outer membrane assembly lipoprotein YfiO
MPIKDSCLIQHAFRKDQLMKKHILRFSLCLACISISGFNARSVIFASDALPSDNNLYKQGSEYLKNSQYIKARLAFQSLINFYSDSHLAPLSYIEIGDSYFNEGGPENLAQAVKEYEKFIIFFPNHPKVPDVQMKIIATNYKLLKAPDLDRQYALRAEKEMQSFLQQFPDSEYVPVVRELLNRVHKILSKTDTIDSQGAQPKSE